MKQQHGVNPARRKDLQAAKRYLDRYQRFMHCLGSRSNGSPIGSGIVESACGQILPERLKRSSMPWYHTGARHIVTQRSMLHSQTWTKTFRIASRARPAVNTLQIQ
jgi:hypothetical protein